ncbi:GNAT family N-acetyltransferase [Streptomyces sp. NBC_00280]|uniref:GNAT family N-acetyltransferase n=1 Tax=Streptomyces sp. NBC_00280 TaxID=2975699 RepID=UPI0032489C92
MELVHAESVDHDATYAYWKSDLHRPEVLIWSGRRRVAAVLEERRPDGTLVLSLPERDWPAAVRPGGRLALAFRADAGRLRRRRLVPLFTTDYTVDDRAGRVEARFPAGLDAEGTRRLPEPVAARLDSSVLFGRPLQIDILRLSPYHGEFVADDPGRCLAPGMSVVIDSWLPWLGGWRLNAQLTGCREEAAGVRFSFRIVDRASVRASAVVLVGTDPGFGFAELRAAGVRPARVARYLTVRTVADDVTHRQALDVRLVGNRHFGRLTDVRDSVEVADRLDAHAVSFVCLLGEKPVGTGRVVVNTGNRALSEIETETVGLPVHIWRGRFVEVSRLAIDPEHRGAGVVVALFRETARLAFNLDCRYLVLDAIEKLVPAYEKIGGTRLPIVKTHPYSKETVHVMAIDMGRQLGVLGRRWPYWQYVFGPVLAHHMRTSSPHVLARLVQGVGVVPFWVKRAVSRVL